MAILELDALTKDFSGKRALDGVSLTVEPGRIVGLLGPNGSGKTTLIKLACGLLTPSAGSVAINGLPPGPASKRLISYLPDRSYLADWMHVSDAIALFKDFYPDFDPTKAQSMLDALGIDPRERIKSLSKGTVEKIHLVLVMSRDAKLFLLDEPIGGVDPAAREFILNTIISNYSPDAAVVISTHLIADVERILDDVVFLREGRVVLASAVDDIRAAHHTSVEDLFKEEFKC